MTGGFLRRAEPRPSDVRIWAWLACVVLSAGVGIVMVEAALRVQEPFWHLMARRYNQHIHHIAHPVWDHWPRPHATIIRAVPHPGPYPRLIRYTTNGYGCRYPREVTVPKPPSVTRVVVLGDSFTEGYYDEDTVAAHLEQRLNVSAEATRRFEVLNCGSSTYSPLLYYLRFTHQLVDLEPDWVVINLDLTDIFDDYWRYRPRMIASPSGEPLAVRGAVGSWSRLKERLRAASYLARIVAEIRAQRPSPPGSLEDRGRSVPTPENVFAYYTGELPVESEAWKREVGFALANLDRLIAWAQARGISVCVTTYPHRDQLEPDVRGRRWSRAVEQATQQLCQARGAAFYSAYDGIAQAYFAHQPVYWKDNMHFTPEGQRIWSTLVARHLEPLVAPAAHRSAG